MANYQNGLILHKPLKAIETHDELVELFYALPERHVERLHIVEKLQRLEAEAKGEEKKSIVKTLQQIQPEKVEKDIISALQIPWGDWSRVYRVRGLYRAIQFIEDLLQRSEENPNVIYNLGFLYYIAYKMACLEMVSPAQLVIGFSGMLALFFNGFVKHPYGNIINALAQKIDPHGKVDFRPF